MLPDKMEHCIVFMNSWDVSDAFWSFSKCNITIPHFPTGDSTIVTRNRAKPPMLSRCIPGFTALSSISDSYAQTSEAGAGCGGWASPVLPDEEKAHPHPARPHPPLRADACASSFQEIVCSMD